MTPPLPQGRLSQALVVGVSEYHHVSRLRPTRDVPGVCDALASPDCCGYPPERVEVLEERAATRDGILSALDALCERARPPGARSFFYFSGHGGTGADGQSYLLPVDARRGAYATTAISARELSQRLARCAGELTVVLDCCRAAGFSTPPGADAPVPDPASNGASAAAAGIDPGLGPFTDELRAEIQARGRVVFAASRADGSAYVSQHAPYGIFTGHLLDGLRGAASTDGSDVTVGQLFDYVAQRVVLSSGRAQRPAFIASIEDFYPLTRYRRPLPPCPVFEKDVYLTYDPDDPVLEDWVTGVFRRELERPGVALSVWDRDTLGALQIDIEEAIVKSRYVVVLLTRAYLESRFEELKTTMAIMQAVNTRSRRFIPVLREQFHAPLYIQAFSGIELTPQREMRFRASMDRLIARLRKHPHAP
ncbi:MAG TPA: caspase family protein [Kofleriaceae bacterium]|nr:caspase family protein [Kofleriaceae bacterium]